MRAVKIFHDRIETRYLEYIESILDHSTSGFAVLTLECALIETLQQFRTGKGKTPKKKVGEYFVSFLTETSFGAHFDRPKAELFYTSIRCGLHHQSEAEGNSRISGAAAGLLSPTPLTEKASSSTLTNSINSSRHSCRNTRAWYAILRRRIFGMHSGKRWTTSAGLREGPKWEMWPSDDKTLRQFVLSSRW